MYLFALILVIIIMCIAWSLDWNKEKILNWCFQSCTKEKVIPVFVVPLPNYKLDMEEIPVQVKQI